MAGRKINGQQQNAMFTMRHRDSVDLRALNSSGVSEAEMDDLVADGYAEVVNSGRVKGRRTWALTSKGNRWVDSRL